MTAQLEKLSEQERSLLLKAPALVSLLAASSDGVMDRTEKSNARELSHLRTFTAEPELRSFYQEAENVFNSVIETRTNQENRIGDDEKKEIQNELNQVNAVLRKLDGDLAEKLKDSLNSYAKHVGNSHKNFVFNALFPVDIPGLTDDNIRFDLGEPEV